MVPCRYRLLLIASIVLLLIYPYFNRSVVSELLLDLVLSLVLIASLLSVVERRHRRLLGWALLVPGVVGTWWPVGGLHPLPHLIGLLFTATFIFYVTTSIFVDVFSRDDVTKDTLQGAVCIYILIGLAWSVVYVFLETLVPRSFNLPGDTSLDYGGLTAHFIYFSYTTLTTTGYGDITPATDVARSLVVIEHGVGVLYIAIMMARLVGMYRPTNNVTSENGGEIQP